MDQKWARSKVLLLDTFASLDFLNFIACALVQCKVADQQVLVWAKRQKVFGQQNPLRTSTIIYSTLVTASPPNATYLICHNWMSQVVQYVHANLLKSNCLVWCAISAINFVFVLAPSQININGPSLLLQRKTIFTIHVFLGRPVLGCISCKLFPQW